MRRPVAFTVRGVGALWLGVRRVPEYFGRQPNSRFALVVSMMSGLARRLDPSGERRHEVRGRHGGESSGGELRDARAGIGSGVSPSSRATSCAVSVPSPAML